MSNKDRFFGFSKILGIYTSFVFVALFMLSCYEEFGITLTANAIGGWNGQDSYRVPIAWCAVVGSPAESSPYIPNPWGGIDTTTDDVLWRRHERASEYVFIPQAGITFRSSVYAPPVLTYPRIPDIDPAGAPGNLTSLNLDLGAELGKLKNACKTAYGGSVNGILAINVRLFWEGRPWDVHDTVGIGMCPVDIARHCTSTGNLAVVDNYFLFPGLPSGKWNNDPMDQALAHELGRALGLDTRNTPNALMNENQQIDSSGMVYNINLNSAEVALARLNAASVPGVNIDPDNAVIKGNVTQSIVVDNTLETTQMSKFNDISSLSVTLDKRNNTVTLDQELSGLFPTRISGKELQNTKFWTFVNLDNNQSTGGNEFALKQIIAPLNGITIKYAGIDLAIMTEINPNIKGKGDYFNDYFRSVAWMLKNDNSTKLEIPFKSHKYTMTIVDELRQNGTKLYPSKVDYPLYDIINTKLDNKDNLIELDKPFSIQDIVAVNGKIVDHLGRSLDDFQVMKLEQPEYPQCSANDVGKGQIAKIDIFGLLPDSEIYLSLGPRFMANGTTGSSGNSTVQFKVPDDVTEGIHLITVGVEDTSLTADCEINIRGI